LTRQIALVHLVTLGDTWLLTVVDSNY